jgi:UDP-N-acetylglucosamine 2-epimerase (non-hydrolysing)
MNNMKILSVFGTRPEAIKMAPLVKELQNLPSVDSRVCVTAQHREMLDQVLELFQIVPEYDLNLMKHGQTLQSLSQRIIQNLSPILEEFKPDIVLVHGDTTTTFMASLCSFYHQIPVGHIEAGLRTGNMYSPWPEEGNRKLTGAIASLHYAPTKNSKKNLLDEGVKEQNILVTGNTIIDALLMITKRIENDKVLTERIKKTLPDLTEEKRIVLVTSHRRENFGEGMENICNAITELADSYPDVEFVFPVHLNPKVRQPVQKLLSGKDNIQLIEPLGYLPFVFLMSRSYIVLTDSGGIQEEAPSLGKPVLVMRDTTERPEAIQAGTVKLVGTSTLNITENVSKLINDPDEYQKMSFAHNPYGDGEASKRITRNLVEYLERKYKHA